MSSLSTELFAAARDDAPSDSLRDAMWDRIADATGAAASAGAHAATQAASTTAKTFGAAKLLAIGGVIGAVSTALGVVVTVAMVDPAGSSSTPAPRTPVVVARGPHGLAGAATLASPTLHKAAPAETRPIAREEKKSDTDEASDLAQEARLLTAARAALVAGDPSRALALVRATRSLSTRALEPEELGLEARALSALGRADEAAATDLLLRRRYPDSALAR